MEPQSNNSSRSPEMAPVIRSGGEVIPGRLTPEQAPVQPERQESKERYNGAPADSPVAAQPATVLPPLPTIAPPAQTTSAPIKDNTQYPATAADDDLIEKEWVEKAKQVIAETKHDPYRQEQEVSKLQADYLKKRYGKVVNVPSDGA